MAGNKKKLSLNVLKYAPSPTFWAIWHSCLKHASEESAELAFNACSWLTGEIGVLRGCCSESELKLLSMVYNHWINEHGCPTLSILQHKAEVANDNELDELLSQYADIASTIRQHEAADLPSLLNLKVEEHKAEKFTALVTIAKAINTVGLKGPGGTTLKGTDEAVAYFVKHLDVTIGGVGGRPVKGVLNEGAQHVMALYEENTDQAGSRRTMRTGITEIDKVCDFKKGLFTGILGYTAQRKTSLMRTIVYNNILMGNNVYHQTHEQSYEEELVIYALIHSHHSKWGGHYKLSLSNFNKGLLSEEEKKFLYHEVLPDLEKLPGKLLIRQPSGDATWPAIKSQVALADREIPIDIFAWDYPALAETEGYNETEEINHIIKQTKLNCLSFRDGEGIWTIAPVQGNRDGYERAAKNEGAWDMMGVYKYSEFDKSLDDCLYVFLDDDISSEGQLIVGSCKRRRGPNVKPTRVGINTHVGIVADLSNLSVDDEIIDAAIERL